MESSIRSTPGLLQQIIFNLPETDSIKIDKENRRLVFCPDDKTMLLVDFNKFIVQNNSLRITIEGKRCLPRHGEINFTESIEIGDIKLDNNSFAKFITCEKNAVGSRIFLTLDMLLSIIYNLPPLPDVKIDIQKGEFLYTPDKDAIITIDMNNIAIKQNLIKVPVDLKYKTPSSVKIRWVGRVPLPSFNIHLACNIILSRIHIEENNILHFTPKPDKWLENKVLNYFRGVFPKEVVYLGNDNYKVDLTQFIPKPYNAKIAQININNGIEVCVC